MLLWASHHDVDMFMYVGQETDVIFFAASSHVYRSSSFNVLAPDLYLRGRAFDSNTVHNFQQVANLWCA